MTALANVDFAIFALAHLTLFLIVRDGVQNPSNLALRNVTVVNLYAWLALPNVDFIELELEHTLK